MKATRTQRLIRIVQILQAGRRCDIEVLSGELNVSRRTIYRDMQVLKESGIGCRYDPDTESYRIDHSFYLRPVDMTMEEGLALMLLTRKCADGQWMPSAQAAISAGLKIEAVLPSDVREFCGSLLDGVEVSLPPVSDGEAVGDAQFRLQRAIAERLKVLLQYDSYYERGEIETVVRPFVVTFRSRGWYLIGHSEMHGEVRTFKLERILQLYVLKETFRSDPKFSLNGHFGQAWNMIRGDQRYHVEVHFSSRVAGNVEEVSWHSTQRTRRRSDGSLVFEVDVDGIDEISWWILGYGDQAIVYEPELLRHLIASHARTLVRYYDNDDITPAPRS